MTLISLANRYSNHSNYLFSNRFSVVTIVLLFSSIFYSANYTAQDHSNKVEVYWGEKHDSPKKSTLSQIIGNYESGLYAFKYHDKSAVVKELIIQQLDKNLNVSNSNTINLRTRYGFKTVKSIAEIQNQLVIFYSKIDLKTEKHELFYNFIDKTTLELPNTPKKIGEIDLSNQKINSDGNFEVRFSKDSTKLLIYCNLPGINRGNEKFELTIFDIEFNKLWSKKVTLPIKDKLINLQKIKINNKGDVFLSCKTYKDVVKAKQGGKPNYNFSILKYSKSNEFQQYDLEMNGIFFNNLDFFNTQENQLLCTGFYSKSGKKDKIKGYYYLRFDRANRRPISKKIHQFETDFIVQHQPYFNRLIETNKEKNRALAEMQNYKLKHIEITKEGELLLISEQFFKSEDNQKGYSKSNYNYNNIIVVLLSSEGETKWCSKIPKRQAISIQKDLYASYFVSKCNDKYYFIFNDNQRNYRSDKGNKIYSTDFSSPAVTMLEIDSSGKMSKEILFTTEETNIKLRPVVCQQINSNNILLFGQSHKKHQFANLKFK